MKHISPTFIAVSASLGFGGLSATADVTSESHPVLNRIFEMHVDADEDGDGVLSFEEFAGFRKTLPAPVQENGKPAGPLSTVFPDGKLLICDFEENNLNKYREWGWKIEGDAFRRDQNYVVKKMARRVGRHGGRYLLSTLVDTDTAVGEVLSPPFTIELDHITFMISGGDFPGRSGVNLIVGNKVVRSAAGRNDDQFEEVSFDTREFKGQQAQIQIIDNHRGFWGHVNVDSIAQTMGAGGARVIDAAPGTFDTGDGFVLTREGRKSGGLRPGTDLGGLLLAVNEQLPDGPGSSRGALQLKNGEIWRGDIVKLEGENVTLNSALSGAITLPLDQIATLQFQAGSEASDEPGNLYRTGGTPIPGKLVWIREKDIAIDCALGVVPLPRPKVLRFVNAIPDDIPPPSGFAEIGFADGSLVRGKPTIRGGTLIVADTTAGQFSLPIQSVCYIRGEVPGVTWLDRLPFKVVLSTGPGLPPPNPHLVAGEDARYLKALRIMPKTILSFDLSGIEERRNLSLRARLSPVPGCESELKLKISTGANKVSTHPLAASAEPIDIAFHLDGSDELVIEVDRVGPLAFPCGLELWDAHLIDSADEAITEKTEPDAEATN